jgi:hypothetical protein
VTQPNDGAPKRLWLPEDDTAPATPTQIDDADDDFPAGPCLNGEEHDVVEVWPATSRVPLSRYCRVCKVGL